MNPRSNALIGQLPETDYQLLIPHLQMVSLLSGKTILQPGNRIDKIHFPVSALLALARDLGDGTRIDVALVGAEGMVGMRGLFGGACLHIVHTAVSGLAYQVPVDGLLQLMQTSSAIYRMCMQAGNELLKTISDELACCHFHCIKQRLARWLLVRQDHLGSNVIEATHQSIADSLGVRREAISHTCGKLDGIRISRGHIELMDRTLLEKLSCNCYFEHKEEQDKQLALPFHS